MAEDLFDIDAAVQEAERLLREGLVDGALAYVAALHPADQATLVADIEPALRAPLVVRLPRQALAEIIDFLEEDRRLGVIQELDPAALGPVLDEVGRDVAADILHELPSDRMRATLANMRRTGEIAPLLPHEDETAGGRMTSDFVALHSSWTVEQALSYLRRTKPEAEQVFYLYVVDDQERLEGVVSLRHLVVAAPDVRIEELMTPEVVSISAGEDQEEALRRVQHYNFVALPVLDDEGRLLGVVSVDDLLDVAEEEATEDMYRMVGLGEETVFSPVRVAARRRLPWLLVNLATAFLGGLTVSLFEDTIARVAVLAVFMPVIAGHGGNTGTQAITLVVRGLALGEVRLSDAFRISWKELRFGLLHGLTAGVLSAALAFVLSGNGWLALVVFCAMLGNVIVAAVVGSLLPLFMRRLGIDPALAAAIWLTTFTDVMGFLLLLGLGAVLVDHIA